MKRLITHIFFICFIYNNLYAQNNKNVAFIENKNQWEENIKFKNEFTGGVVFFENNCITYVLQDKEAVEKIFESKYNGKYYKDTMDLNVTYYAFKVHFNKSNTPITCKGENVFSDYNNYYIGNDPKHWASNVHKYSSITYENLYKGIHLKYYEKNELLKYEFIVENGANPQNISLTYEGVNGLKIKKGNLHIQCGEEEIIELKPYAYQLTDSGDVVPVNCNFSVKNKTVTFKVDNYDTTKTLYIDPVLTFCSYSGSYADNWGYTATYDGDGNLYGGGNVFDLYSYPTTTGAFQVNFAGGSEDIGISKFNATGTTLLFSTYLGGSGSEVPHSLIVNDNNELYVLASTSSLNFPVTSTAYDTSFNGGSLFILTSKIYYINGVDIAISKFNVSGTQLIGSTYFGGSGNDGLSTDTRLLKNYADEVRGEIMVDEFSNVYIVSSTSSTNLPISSTAYQPTYGGGKQDGCIAKFNYDLSNLIWSSYLGGDSSEALYSMSFDEQYNVYVCGGTNSRNFPTTSGVIQPSYAGGITDGFIAKISTNGNQLIYGTYFGKTTFDQTYLIKLDRSNAVYIMGLTDAIGVTWVKNATWYIPNGGQFISKLNSSLSQIIWSTAFGTGGIGPDISPTALMVDLCKNIYISGWGSPLVNITGGTSGLPLSSNAFQKTTDNNDFYFFSLSEDASRLVFATYFGGKYSAEHVDGGTSRFDKKGCIYQAICSGCGGHQDLPVTSGVVSQYNRSTNCNLGVVKIDFNLPAVVADFTCPNVICAPYTVNFVNKSQVISMGSTYYWDFGDGSSSNQKNPSHLYTNSGVFKIKLIVSDTGSCNFFDTLVREIVVLSNSSDTLPTKTICKGDFIQIGIAPAANPNVTYSWLPTNGLNNPSIANPIASPTTNQTYLLFITDGYCVDTFRQKVNVITTSLDAGPQDTACLGDTIQLKATIVGGATYIWSSNKNFSDTLNHPLTQPIGKDLLIQSQTYYIKISNAYCTLTDSVTIIESHIRCSIDTVKKICIEDSIYLSAKILTHQAGKNVNYTWQPATNVLSGKNTASPLITVNKPTYFYLTVNNEHGCKSKDTVFVNVFNIDYTVDIKNIRCFGLHDGHIIININPNSSPCTFKWENNVGSGNKAENLPVGTYHVQIIDTNKCVYNFDTTLSQPTKINPFFYDTNTYVYCNDSCTGYASGGAKGGVPPYTYWWITGDVTNSITNLCAGEYVFVVTDKNLCTDTAKLNVYDSTNFHVSYLTTPVTCYGDCNGKIALFPMNGRSPYTYLWKNGYDKDTASSLCAGIYDIYIKDTTHCTRRVFPVVKSPDSLVFSLIEMHRPSCYSFNNGKIIAHISGGTPPYRFFWDGVKGNDSLTNLTEGKHTLKIIDSNLCEIDTVLTLLQYDSLDIDYSIIKTPCVEACYGQAILQVSGGCPPYSYSWSNGDTSYHPKRLCYGENSVMITDSNGCKKMLYLNIGDSSYYPKEVEAWTDSSIIYRAQVTTLNVTDFGATYKYSWTPAESITNPLSVKAFAKPKNTTTYTITVTDPYGCQKSDTVTIYVLDVICEDPYVFVPNAFTPNNDNNNDILYVRGKLLTSVHLVIFDRWGEKIFETNDLHIGWDGTFKGKMCEPGVYVFYLEATCLGDLFYFYKGNVTLIR